MNPRSSVVPLSVAASLILLAGCAIRLGGPRPFTFRVLGYAPKATATAEEVARRIREVAPHYVILAADRDSSWFGEVARAANLQSTRPGRAESVTFAFLGAKALGDTTVTLTGGPHRFTVHDALYDLTKHLRVDVMAFRLGVPAAEAREPVRALMGYVATDVPAQALVVLGVLLPDTAQRAEIARTLSPYFRDAATCEASGGEAALGATVQLYFAPAVRARCERARAIESGAGLILEIQTRG